MNMLFINHGAKGIAMWDYPTVPSIANITSLLSEALTSELVTPFLLGSFFQAVDVVGLQRVDVAYWSLGNRTLVSVVNKNYIDSPAAHLSISLPRSFGQVGQVVWGSGWSVDGGNLTKVGIEALSVDLFVVS